MRIGTTFRLAKLPPWGEMVNTESINFEWPNKTGFERMDPAITLTSLTFKTDGGQISSVMCTYSNGDESPTYEKEAFEHHSSQGSVTFN